MSKTLQNLDTQFTITYTAVVASDTADCIITHS